jgi:tRNA G18 (ribose-2'-O)-methylase SpoU
LLALTPHPDAVSLQHLKIADGDPLIVVVGSEGYGLTTPALTHADLHVRIPIDPRADSLNVVVAAGIVLHALS